MRVAILGGGIAGLTAAHRLCGSGAEVSLFEASEHLGGLGAWFEYKGHQIDRYYHVMLDSDTHLVNLIEELGLADRLKWRETKMGFCVDGQWYPFNTPLDLLRFKALSFANRLRTGFGALYITKLKRNGEPLDNEFAHQWLLRLFGPQVYQSIWEPLIKAKFGDMRHQVPAYWVWNTLNREKDGSQEIKGYLNGGYATIAHLLKDKIEAAGGTVKMSTPVTRIETTNEGVQLETAEGKHDFDATVSTLPLPLLKRIATDPLSGQVPLPDLSYQGVVNVILIMRKQLTDYYWTALVNCDLPYQGIVETTHVIPPQWLDGRHIVYLMNYCSADSEAYRLSDEAHRSLAVESLKKILPDFDPAVIEDTFVFRAPHVEPVWTLGYLQKRPAPQIANTPVYLATTAQAYPMVTSWNTSVKLADDAVGVLLSNHGNTSST